MRNLINYLNCGQCNLRANQNAIEFAVTKFSNIAEKIIPFLTKYPLQGIKSLNFASFLKCAELIKNKAHLTQEGLDKIREIKAGMNTGLGSIHQNEMNNLDGRNFGDQPSRAQRAGTNIRIIPVFSIELHKKDLSLIKEIQSFFGVGTIRIRQRAGKPTVIYSVQSLKNLTEIIIPHFKQYSLLTQKQTDFILFSKVIDLMNQKKHLELDGINKIISIRASMNKGLTCSLKTVFPNIIPVERPIIEDQVIKNPLWLVGFVDGEGCFYVKVNKSARYITGFGVRLAFSICQHSRDSSLLNIIKDYLGCGVIENVSTRPNTTNFVTYGINDLLNKIIPFLNQNPLLGKKLLDYKDFSRVAFLMKDKAHLTEKGVNKIRKIKMQMNTGRKFE